MLHLNGLSRTSPTKWSAWGTLTVHEGQANSKIVLFSWQHLSTCSKSNQASDLEHVWKASPACCLFSRSGSSWHSFDKVDAQIFDRGGIRKLLSKCQSTTDSLLSFVISSLIVYLDPYIWCTYYNTFTHTVYTMLKIMKDHFRFP